MKKRARQSDRTPSTSTAVAKSEPRSRRKPKDPAKKRKLKVVQGGGGERWDLRLYIAGETARSRAAINNLRKICDQYLPSNYTIEVIDLLKNPALARGDQIVALPTLVRKLPAPIRKIIGDLSDTERVLVGLDLRPRKP